VNLQTMATITGLPLPECRSYRMDYLKQHILERTGDLSELLNYQTAMSDAIAEVVLAEVTAEARELRHLIQVSRPGYKQPSGTITPEMIEQARASPIERLVEFDRSGKSFAWCHDDRQPSLSWHRASNRATCFPCGRSFNPIDILTSRDGFSFQAAVKHLNQ